MGQNICTDSGPRNDKSFHGLTPHEVLLHDRLDIRSRVRWIPDPFRVYDYHRSACTEVETARFVRANPLLQPARPQLVRKPTPNLTTADRRTTSARIFGRALIHANEDVMLKSIHQREDKRAPDACPAQQVSTP